jgi:Restriction endonuclease NaeI
MNPDHPDYTTIKPIVDEIVRLSGGTAKLKTSFPLLVQEAVDFVIDPIRTARTMIRELDNVEKTFIGLKIEHFLRDFLGVPKGLRDLRIGDLDIDVKNTVLKSWMIPPETFRNSEPCALVMVTQPTNCCSFGVMVARADYLNKDNRDKKRQVSAKAFEHIWWLLLDEPLPESRFYGVDMERFRQLRKIRGGAKRAAQFFRENLNICFHRNVVLGLLYDQRDPMKRVRDNGGARDILAPDGVALFSGAYHGEYARINGIINLGRDQFVAVSVGREQAITFAKLNRKSKRG